MTDDALFAGIGLRPGTGRDEIEACLALALAEAGAVGAVPLTIATLSARAAEPGLIAVAQAHRAQIIGIPDEALAGMDAGCATRSTRIAGLYGVGSVAEAAALAAAGPGSALVVPRIATARVTCALARATERSKV